MIKEDEPTDLIQKTDKLGRVYHQRKDRNRFFYPDEWKSFMKVLEGKKSIHLKPLFDFMFNTGTRLDECLHIRPKDFDFDRQTVRIWKVKRKAKKKAEGSYGKPRTISLSTAFCKRMKRHCKDFKNEQYIFHGSIQSVNQVMNRALQRAKIEDYYNFSSHNIRKTHGMYIKALGIDIAEICTRLGHDYNTYLRHYGSADVFSEKDMRHIRELLDDLYFRKRRY